MLDVISFKAIEQRNQRFWDFAHEVALGKDKVVTVWQDKQLLGLYLRFRVRSADWKHIYKSTTVARSDAFAVRAAHWVGDGEPRCMEWEHKERMFSDLRTEEGICQLVNRLDCAGFFDDLEEEE